MTLRISPFVLLGAALSAQGPDALTTRGSLAAMPFVLSMQTSLSANSQDHLLAKLPGDQVGVPPAITVAAPGMPSYVLAHLFPALNSANRLHELDMDAISTGNDRIKYDMDGKVNAAFLGGWTRLVFGVRNGAQGAGGPVAARRLAGFSVGSDLYSYTFGDSIGSPDALLDAAVLEIPGEHVSLAPNQDLQAADSILAELLLTGGNAQPLGVYTGRLYFSVTLESAVALNSGTPVWPTIHPIDPGTIYEIVFDGQTATWQPPHVVFSREVLGMVEGEDIDALAVDATGANALNNKPQSVLLSTKYEPEGIRQPSQIMAVTSSGTSLLSGPYLLKPLKDMTGAVVTERMDLIIIDDLDVLCSIDPDANTFNSVLGTPYPTEEASTNGLYETLGLSIAWTPVAPAFQGAQGVHFLVSGWCQGPVEDGMVHLYMSTASSGGLPTFGPPDLLLSVPRAAHQSSLDVFLPTSFARGTYGLRGFYAVWVGDSGPKCLSYASGIQL